MKILQELEEDLKLIQADSLRDLASWQKYERSMKDKYREEGGILDESESAVSSKMLKILCIIGAVFTAVNLLIHYLL
jgi:hypothetical protein